MAMCCDVPTPEVKLGPYQTNVGDGRLGEAKPYQIMLVMACLARACTSAPASGRFWWVGEDTVSGLTITFDVGVGHS